MAKNKRNKGIRIQIVERKLGREKAWGQCWTGDKFIEIDPTQDSKNYLDTLIHETLHELIPRSSEETIEKCAATLTAVIWKCQYRRIMK
jgi:hypothetical protein